MMIINPYMLPKVRSESLRQACQHMPCTLRISSFIPGFRCSGDDTVVGCHIDKAIGKGTGTKVSDLFMAAACLHCHDLIDRRNIPGWAYIVEKYPAAVMERLLKGVAETQSRWVQMGLITGEDWEIVG